METDPEERALYERLTAEAQALQKTLSELPPATEVQLEASRSRKALFEQQLAAHAERQLRLTEERRDAQVKPPATGARLRAKAAPLIHAALISAGCVAPFAIALFILLPLHVRHRPPSQLLFFVWFAGFGAVLGALLIILKLKRAQDRAREAL